VGQISMRRAIAGVIVMVEIDARVGVELAFTGGADRAQPMTDLPTTSVRV
jgi:hypothetical protein